MKTTLIKHSATWKAFLLHLATGVVATAVHYAVMAAALIWISSAAMASSVGFLAGALTRFLTAHKVVFLGPRRLWPTVARFVMSLLIQLALNAFFLNFFLLFTNHLWLAQAITTGLMVTFNFIVYKKWVFKNSAQSPTLPTH